MRKVINLFKTLFSKINGHLPGKIYELFFIDLIPRFFGGLSIVFYSIIYRNVWFGKNGNCWGRIYLWKSPESSIIIGDNARIMSDFLRAGIAIYSRVKITAFANSKIIIGNNVALVGTSITCRMTRIEIMDGTLIGPNTIIIDSDVHSVWPPENRINTPGYENDRPIKIGKNVWIGMNSIILKGVTIGENSVITAGSLVKTDIPPNVLAGGNPARVIKPLGVDSGKERSIFQECIM